MEPALGLALFRLWQLFLLIALYMVGSGYVAGLRERIGTGSWPGLLDPGPASSRHGERCSAECTWPCSGGPRGILGALRSVLDRSMRVVAEGRLRGVFAITDSTSPRHIDVEDKRFVLRALVGAIAPGLLL